MCNKRYISKPQNKEIGSVSRKTDSPMSFFPAPCFSGWIPIWSVGARHVCLLAPVFKPTWEGAQGGAPSDIQVAPVAQRGWCKFLVLELYWYPTKTKLFSLFFSPTIFWLNSHLVHGYPPSLLILPGLLRSDQGDLSASSPSGEREDTCGLCRWWLVFHVNQVIQPLFLC